MLIIKILFPIFIVTTFFFALHSRRLAHFIDQKDEMLDISGCANHYLAAEYVKLSDELEETNKRLRFFSRAAVSSDAYRRKLVADKSELIALCNACDKERSIMDAEITL